MVWASALDVPRAAMDTPHTRTVARTFIFPPVMIIVQYNYFNVVMLHLLAADFKDFANPGLRGICSGD